MNYPFSTGDLLCAGQTASTYLDNNTKVTASPCPAPAHPHCAVCEQGRSLCESAMAAAARQAICHCTSFVILKHGADSP